ncbi:hypothetical protein [Catenulispora pinistramenti]|uniref:hypothetical protein n=1 Tax=Catenulispora pinistramenti TaxID=2705254 RepID=UPI0034D53665
MVQDAGQADPGWLRAARTVGVTAGASAPEHPVAGVLAWLSRHGADDVEQVTTAHEDIRFSGPPMPERAPSAADRRP